MIQYSDFTKAVIRFLLSLPLLVLLFGSVAFPSMLAWSRLYAPNWTETLAMLEKNIGLIECSTAILLMCIHYPIYLRAFTAFRRHLPSVDTLLSVSTIAAFIFGALPHILDRMADYLVLSPAYSSTMSALLAFSAIGPEFPSYLHLIGLWIFFSSLSSVLRAHAAILMAHAAVEPALPEEDAYLNLSPLTGHAAIISIVIVVLSGLAWSLLGVSLPFTMAFCLFLLLTVAPCTLPIAEALPLWIGAALLDKNGISLRSLRTIEAASVADMLVLAKSDILTEGEPQITDIVPEGITLTALMSLAAAAESGSRHPVAKTISEHAIRLRAKYGRIAAFNESPGEGVEVLMNGAPIRVGQKAWIESQGVRISANLLTKDDQLAEKGKTILYVSNGKNAKGLIAYEYALNTDALETISALEKQGITTILMVGEGPRTAKAIAKQLGISDFRHSIRAVDLVREIQLLQAHGKNVALFVNLPEESPAVKQADCPILPFFEQEENDSVSATSSETSADSKIPPSEIIIESTLLSEHPDAAKKIVASRPPLPALVVKNLTSLPIARSLSLKILSMIRHNTLFAFLGPLLLLPISSGLLFTLGGPFPAPWLVAFAALPGLIAVTLNAFRMGRELAVESKINANIKKEDELP